MAARRHLAALQALADTAGRITWDVSLDSTSVPTTAAGARKRGTCRPNAPGRVSVEPADYALGRSGGGLTMKLHLGCEQGQKPLAMVLTAGQRGNSPEFIPVLAATRIPRLITGRPTTRPDRVLADKAYTSKANRAYLRRRGIAATIPSKAELRLAIFPRSQSASQTPRPISTSVRVTAFVTPTCNHLSSRER
ncbi:transposase [Micromonospora aurantiaca]|uniref:transposase n=1 Tax=Micromonospora aurantiaca (nom. illeg.) TaxID=47850 RepID=UPI0037878F89